ncbi:MAG: hypothetical protein UHT92_00525 [Prevotella sp.]|nr:hypothetical protein [Prevotella sp.]
MTNGGGVLIWQHTSPVIILCGIYFLMSITSYCLTVLFGLNTESALLKPLLLRFAYQTRARFFFGM